jgi:hypothetical protein
MNGSRLIFIHIPKTGGSAFVGKIINLWPKAQVSPHTGMEGFLTDPHLNNYNFCAGHTFYPKMKEIMPPAKYMTILRDPIERVYSHWRHLERFNLTDVKTFEDFVEEMTMPLSDEELYDRAVRCLEGFWYIGYQDKWVDAVKRIYDEFNLPLPPDTKQKELTNYRALMSDEVIADLERFNQVDTRIYNEYRN